MKRLLAIALLLGAGFMLTLGYLGRLNWTPESVWLATAALVLGLAAGVSLARREPQNAIYILLATGALIALLYTNGFSVIGLVWDVAYQPLLGGGLLVGILSGALL